MKSLPRISEAEWEIMKVLWARSPLTAKDIIETLNREEEWHPKTTKTLLNRLVQKKALGFKQEGRAYVYRSLVRKDDCVSAASESFLERVFGGSLTPLVAHFVERRKLNPKQIAELKRLLEQ